LFERRCARVVTLVQPYSLGYNQELLVRLDVLPKHVEAAVASLSHENGVHHIASNFGATTIVCELMLKSLDDLRSFTHDVIAKLPGLTRMAVEIELIVYKRGFLLCPWVHGEPAGISAPAKAVAVGG
jgi:hypothetical protein